ncbi:MAG TPA: hypothetical protein VGM90_13000 [Kofleriaceae bacterium]|jgi:hypothetical protein
MLVELTCEQLARLAKYHVEVYPLTGDEAAEQIVEVRYQTERPKAQIAFTWLLRSLLRCQSDMADDEKETFVSISTFFENRASKSRWKYDADDYDLFIEVETRTFTAMIQRARDACATAQPDGSSVLDAPGYVLALEQASLDELLGLLRTSRDAARTMLTLTWGA